MCSLKTSDFDFELPEELIAQQAVEQLTEDATTANIRLYEREVIFRRSARRRYIAQKVSTDDAFESRDCAIKLLKRMLIMHAADPINATTLLPYAEDIAYAVNEFARLSPRFQSIYKVNPLLVLKVLETREGKNAHTLDFNRFSVIRHRIFWLVDALCNKNIDFQSFWFVRHDVGRLSIMDRIRRIIADNIVEQLYRPQNMHFLESHILLGGGNNLSVLDWEKTQKAAAINPNKHLSTLSDILECSDEDIYPKKLFINVNKRNGRMLVANSIVHRPKRTHTMSAVILSSEYV